MKTKMILVLCLMSLFSKTFAQNFSDNKKIIVSYQENINFPKEISNTFSEQEKKMYDNILYSLLIDNSTNESTYLLNENTLKYEAKQDNKTTVSSIAEYATYKNFKNNELLIRTELFNSTYIIENKLTNLDWEITDEITTIGNFQCRKAILEKNGSKIIAYYTDKIPISEGPSLYYGLPGLIIKLEAKDRNYLVKKIDYIENAKIKKFANGKRMSEEKYKEIMNERRKNPIIYEEKSETMSKVSNED